MMRFSPLRRTPSSSRPHLRAAALTAATALALLAASAPALAEDAPEARRAPAVSIGERSSDFAPAPHTRLPRTLPGTRAAEERRLTNLDPSRWLSRYGAVSSRSTRSGR